MKKYEIDMSRGSVAKNILLFAIPLMASSVLQLMFNAADIIIVGRFDGETALAAVGSTSSLINLVVNVFMGYATGAAVVISRHFGAGDGRGTGRAVSSCISMSVIFGFFILLVGVVFGRSMLEIMRCPENVIESAALYIRIYFLGMPAFMLYNFGSGVLRAVGDTRRPLLYLAIAGVTNVILNLFFVIKLHMGVAGVAAATAISQCISAFLVIRCLIRTDGSYRLDIKKLRIDKKEFVFMTKIGLPAGVQGSLFSIANVTIQSVINGFGSAAVAGSAAAANIEGFVYVIVNCIAQAALTFTGQNLGAGKISRVKKGVIISLFLQAGIALGASLLVLVFSHQLAGLYVEGEEVIGIAATRLSIICLTYFICGFNEVFVAGLRGLGASILPMITSVFGICVLRLLYIATIFKIFSSLESLYLTYPVSWLVTGAVNGIIFAVVFRRTEKSIMLTN